MAEEPTRLYFPLRTSVELFRDPASPAAEVRAKQGAVLYEEIAFESGAFEVTITTTGGVSQRWRPTEELADEDLRDARQIHEQGTPFSLSIGIQPAKGVCAPPEAMRVGRRSTMRTIVGGDVSRHYVAEWESV